MKALTRLMRVPVPWIFVLTYLIGVALEFVLPLATRIKGVPGLGLAGAVMFSMGAVLAGWSLLIFHRKGTTTVPGQVSSAFVTSGPYRISRNPMYGGLVLAYLGEAGILRQIWPLVVVPFTIAYINSIVIPVEEARLEEVYPSEYPRYRARVRRWI